MKNLTAKCEPGDLFYIPAFSRDGECGIVIARYIELLQPNVGHLIEIFDRHYLEVPKEIVDIDMSRRLLRPVMFSMYFKNIPRWKILFSDPHYKKSDSNYEEISFAFYSYAWVGGKKVEVSKKDLEKLEDSTCWGSEQLIFLVNAYIAGMFKADERYQDNRVPTDLQISNTTEYARVVELAKIVDKKINNVGSVAQPPSKKI